MASGERHSSSEQEKFWAGTFGDEYIDRNKSRVLRESNEALFARILSRTEHVGSVLELGANIGLNLMAIRQPLPGVELSAVEINEKAVSRLRELEGIEVHAMSIMDFKPVRQWNFVLVKTVLIHMPPETLPTVYDLLYSASDRYVCMVEYYNPTPVEIVYRGHEHKLFKRDFAGEFADRFDDVRLVDYGFVYHRDPRFPQDDVTWFLFDKQSDAT